MMFASFRLFFKQKLANVPPGQNVGKHTPPKSGGLVGLRASFFGKKSKICWREHVATPLSNYTEHRKLINRNPETIVLNHSPMHLQLMKIEAWISLGRC